MCPSLPSSMPALVKYPRKRNFVISVVFDVWLFKKSHAFSSHNSPYCE
jgi:hypothetical protein